jgi:hypothetical protein
MLQIVMRGALHGLIFVLLIYSVLFVIFIIIEIIGRYLR